MSVTRPLPHREVVNIVSDREVLLKSLPPSGPIEVRGRQNETWGVWYPDPAFIPCAPVCDLKKVIKTHAHDYEQKWIETNYKPASYEDAIEWATYLSDGREVKIVPFMTAAEKKEAILTTAS